MIHTTTLKTSLTTPTANECLFELDDESLLYRGRTILNNLSLKIHRGERIALVGASGSGKSTLLKHLREQQPRHIAWCPQEHGLVPTLSVYHNIFMGGLQRHGHLYNLINLIKPLSRPLVEISELAHTLQLQDQLFQSVDQLSGGQQQRTAIGRACYQQQSIFLGDEPVSAVDDYQAEHLLNVISHRHETLILALHDVPQALRVCDRIIGLKDARIVLDAHAGELKESDLAALYPSSTRT